MNTKTDIKKPSKKQLITLRTMIVFGLLSVINFLYWFLDVKLIDNKLLYTLLVLTLLYGFLRIVYEWYHYWSISIPEQKTLTKDFSVDIFTTYFPGEPYDMVIKTLKAIQKITYPHTTYLCDEANDEYLIQVCKDLGVKHVTRNNRVDAKAGNINNALKLAKGELCVILDPDHIPEPNLLDFVVPHFSGDEIGYVQIVQSYSNRNISYVAKGAAQQTYQFYGPMMMTMNSYGTVNAIGANCTFRRAALDSINGHAAGLSEDMHTAMKLHAKGWKSVYVPKVLTRGLVPSTLTAYYKQQLKWSRGTLELLYSVYPKLFKKFNWRQKIHYGTSPLHYLIGIFYFINFLIPIISLTTATTPWKGNVLYFGIILAPLMFSIFIIRSYVQRWVMEEKERGYHLVGGLLQISAWWVFCIGFIYTVIRKKVPYLPTPKEDNDKSNWKILAPNIIIGLISLFSIVYGLSIDFTPFSIFMSGFALLNSFFMFFTLYLSKHKYNHSSEHKTSFKQIITKTKNGLTETLWRFRHAVYKMVREIALPILLSSVLLSSGLLYYMNYMKWDGLKPPIHKKVGNTMYFGAYSPDSINNGLSNINKIKKIEDKVESSLDIISFYIPWSDKTIDSFQKKLIQDIYNKNSTPMITWEPWASTFEKSEENEFLKNEKRVFEHINSGFFDEYITQFATTLKQFNKPVYLRFAHEFDNPSYPWSISGNNSAEDFKKAWIHVYNIFKRQDALNVIWVWNPWKPESIKNYNPGDEYFDWIGVTSLNYGELNPDKKWYEFGEIYRPFNKQIEENYLDHKPIMISEFGSIKKNGKQNNWFNNAFDSIHLNYPKIKSIIFFDNPTDVNWPTKLKKKHIDWSINDYKIIKDKITLLKNHKNYALSSLIKQKKYNTSSKKKSLPLNTKGIIFKKGQNWYKNYYTLTRQNLIKDFNIIKQLGINTIKYEGENVYNKNVFSISKEMELNVVYSFWIPNDIDFVNDFQNKTELKLNIIRKINTLKKHTNIISWNISSDALSGLKSTYDKATYLYQRAAYLQFIDEITSEIKKIDSTRPLIVDIEITPDIISNIELLNNYNDSIDIYGFNVKDDQYLSLTIAYCNENEINYVYSDIHPKSLTNLKVDSKNSIFIRNFQDIHEYDLVTFDGLIDRKNRLKKEYVQVYNKLNDKKLNISFPDINIIKPSRLLVEDRLYRYHAVFENENEWKYSIYSKEDRIFEWQLIKTDEYGNCLGIKELGNGTNTVIKIPKDYENYLIQLTLIRNGYTSTTRSKLNTKLHSSIKRKD